MRRGTLALAVLLLACGDAGAEPCTREPVDALERLLADLGPAVACGPVRAEDIPAAQWTFYVHLAADNDLASFGMSDLQEMARAGSAPGRTNVFVLADGPASWGPARLLWMPPAGSGCGPREVRVDGLLAARFAEPNMGDPALLHDTLAFLTAKVPARHVFLDLWNHGSGWRGIAFDDSGDHLDFAGGELASAIAGLPVDVLGADACLTATLEVALSARELSETPVRALVASQETEPGHGWAYDDLLRRLSGAIDPDRDVPLFDVVAEAVRSYEGTGAETLSATDLRMAGYVVDDVGKLADAIVEAGGFANNEALRTAYESSLRFGSRDLLDIGDFARNIALRHDGELRQRALAVLSALAGATVHGTGTGGRYEDAHGLSIYAPLGSVDPRYAAAPWSAFWMADWNRAIGSYLASPEPGFVVPEWARARESGRALPQSSTSWSNRRNLPVALSWSNTFGYTGKLEVYYGGLSATGGARFASASLDRAAKTLRIRLEPDGDASGFDGLHDEEMFSDHLTFAPPGEGVWTVVFEHGGRELARTEWWPGKT